MIETADRDAQIGVVYIAHEKRRSTFGTDPPFGDLGGSTHSWHTACEAKCRAPRKCLRIRRAGIE